MKIRAKDILRKKAEEGGAPYDPRKEHGEGAMSRSFGEGYEPTEQQQFLKQFEDLARYLGWWFEHAAEGGMDEEKAVEQLTMADIQFMEKIYDWAVSKKIFYSAVPWLGTD